MSIQGRFEAWAQLNHLSVRKEARVCSYEDAFSAADSGDYSDERTWIAWRAWEAALSFNPQSNSESNGGE